MRALRRIKFPVGVAGKQPSVEKGKPNKNLRGGPTTSQAPGAVDRPLWGFTGST